jgi:hypothetical protein
VGTNVVRRSPMGREEDSRRFQKTCAVYEEKTRNVSEEASEKTGESGKRPETRQLSEEAGEVPEEKHERPSRENQER